MQLSWETRRRTAATFVHLRLDNDAAHPRRVRVANRLDGPVWFPRRGGYPAAGWDDGGFEGVLAGGESRALGYACPAPPAEPPAEVAWTERAAGDTPRLRPDCGPGPGDPRPDGGPRPDGDRAGRKAAEHVVRALGDPRPPRDAVGVDPAAAARRLRATAVGRRAAALRGASRPG